MVKVAKLPSKHGLERKFKPHRKKKSSKFTNASPGTKTSSLKNRLRSLNRKLAASSKLGLSQAQRSEISAVIESVEAEILGKSRSLKERGNAVKYHGVKFFEKQKLKRLGRRLSSLGLAAVGEREARSIVDKGNGYIDNYPKSEKYVAIFRGGDDPVPDKLKARHTTLGVRGEVREGLRSDSDSDSDSGSSSSDSDDSSPAAGTTTTTTTTTTAATAEASPPPEEDDFFTTEDADLTASLAKAKESEPHLDLNAKGDKSSGWRTQKQGVHKRKRQRN
ncbi:hypothetical protein TrRE_jg10681 [Triparma retinervis]|uniref:rRNA-processing protein EFG1 n=1 Tax=Triparma retinervis TaxID=2557542 RepID=A0A9W7DQ66_9STRA|nr:hypothetical protein TrRE_jg10681 [Triparma retinervis]